KTGAETAPVPPRSAHPLQRLPRLATPFPALPAACSSSFPPKKTAGHGPVRRGTLHRSKPPRIGAPALAEGARTRAGGRAAPLASPVRAVLPRRAAAPASAR